MTATLNPSRYAHCEGYTGVCFSQDASYIVTCGGEGDIRIWTGIEDDEAVDKCVGEKAFSVCQRGEKLFVATDQNNIQALTFPEAELDGIVSRFTAPVTHIDASADGSILVAASCDMTIGVTRVEEGTTDRLEGHRAPVTHVALDPKLEYLASSSCDGSVRVWRLSDQSQLVSWTCLPTANSWTNAATVGGAAWLPGSGATLAVPAHNPHQVRLYRRQSWEQTATFSAPQMLSIVCISSCGQYLAASSTAGYIFVWAMGSESLLAEVQTEEKLHICSLAWSSQLAQLAFTDTGGNFGTLELDTPPATEDVPIGVPTFADSDEDEDNVNAISLEKIKNESGFLAGDDDLKSVEEDGRMSRGSDDVRPVTVAPVVELQPPFQPASTPVGLQYRFMVWNDVGVVKQVNTEEENVIDVEFHDTSRHHAFRVNNHAGHSVAALSDEALVMANEAPSKLVCVVLGAWDGSKEWSTQLSDDEAVLCVAAGQGFVAAATDSRYLRVFSSNGTQLAVFSVPGPVVCLAAQERTLAVVFHSSPGLGGDQWLTYWLLHLGVGGSVSETVCGLLPISPKARLRWFGFSDEGSLCSLDVAGVLRKHSAENNIWLPICEVDKQCKGQSDHHFVVGVSESFQTIRSILCKGAFYPATTPRPTVSELSWQVPVCEGEEERGGLEEQLLRCQAAVSRDTTQRTINKTLLKLFALACTSGLEARAVELCSLMSREVAQLATKYAVKQNRQHLADRITNQYIETQRPEEDLLRVDSPLPPMSQDMFASSMEQAPSLSDNPILALKQRQPVTNSSSELSNTIKRSNPFKKSVENKDESDKGLAGLVRPSEQTVTKSIPNENKPKKNVFADWYSSQKQSLEEEFPELNASELTKVALKRFKEEQKKPNSNQSMKRFFGTSTSNIENKKETETTTILETDSKKRKACDDEVSPTPQTKKTSVTSKLKKFSFVKP